MLYKAHPQAVLNTGPIDYRLQSWDDGLLGLERSSCQGLVPPLPIIRRQPRWTSVSHFLSGQYILCIYSQYVSLSHIGYVFILLRYYLYICSLYNMSTHHQFCCSIISRPEPWTQHKDETESKARTPPHVVPAAPTLTLESSVRRNVAQPVLNCTIYHSISLYSRGWITAGFWPEEVNCEYLWHVQASGRRKQQMSFRGLAL